MVFASHSDLGKDKCTVGYFLFFFVGLQHNRPQEAGRRPACRVRRWHATAVFSELCFTVYNWYIDAHDGREVRAPAIFMRLLFPLF